MPFSLIGTLGLDTSPYESALSKVERTSLQSNARMREGMKTDSMDPFLANSSKWGNSAKNAANSHANAYRSGFMAQLAGMFKGVPGIGAIGAAGPAGAALAVATAGISIAKNSINAGGALQDQSDRTNISPEKLQKWDLAAKQSGATLSDLISSFTKMGPKVQEAIDDPLSDAAESFKRFGLETEDLKKLSMEEIFETLAGKIGKSTVNARLLTDIMQTMGKGGSALIPTFKTGLDGDALVNSTKEIANLDATGDKLTRAWEKSKVLTRKATALASNVFDLSAGGLVVSLLAGPPKEEPNSLSADEKETMQRTSEESIEETGKQKKQRKAAEAKAAADAAKTEEETQKRIAAIQDQSTKQVETNRLAAMTAEERLVELTEKRAAIVLDLNKPGLSSREESAKKALEIAQLDGQIAGLGKVKPEPLVRQESHLDSLSRIGGFTGGAEQGMRAEYAKQTGLLEQVVQWTRRNPRIGMTDGL